MSIEHINWFGVGIVCALPFIAVDEIRSRIKARHEREEQIVFAAEAKRRMNAYQARWKPVNDAIARRLQ